MNNAEDIEKAMLLQQLRQIAPLAPEHAGDGILEFATGLPLDQLAIE